MTLERCYNDVFDVTNGYSKVCSLYQMPKDLDFILSSDDFSPLMWTVVRQIRPFTTRKDLLNIFNSMSLFIYVLKFTDYNP